MYICMGFPGGAMVKNILLMQEKQEMGIQEDPLDEEMATHSSNLTWKIPWTEESGSLWGFKDSDTTEQLSTHT